MQSGIKASDELKSAFQSLLSSPATFAVLAHISSESITPSQTIPSQAGFPSDLSQLKPHLSETAAAYILLRAATDGSVVAVTYVPNAAPVRDKMLYASTRLALVRELGTEHISETIFATLPEELTPAGWAKHEAHRALDAPLTGEEAASKALAEAESNEGTGRRVGHYTGSSGGKLGLKVGDGVVEALKGIVAEGLVQIKIDVSTETLVLEKNTQVSPSGLKGEISSEDPRYTFYGYPVDGGELAVLFIYTCPSASKIKERMVYAAGRAGVVSLAEGEAGLTLARRMEGSGPDDFSEQALQAEFATSATENKVESKGFARPKRPGRR